MCEKKNGQRQPNPATGEVNAQVGRNGRIDVRALSRELSRTLNEPGYEYWASIGTWTLNQAVALMVRQNPYHLQDYPEEWERLGMPAVIARTILAPIYEGKEMRTSSAVIKRADELELPVPIELRQVVTGKTRAGNNTSISQHMQASEARWAKSNALYAEAVSVAEKKWHAKEAREWDHAEMASWLEGDYTPDGEHVPLSSNLVSRATLLKYMAQLAERLGKKVRGKKTRK